MIITISLFTEYFRSIEIYCLGTRKQSLTQTRQRLGVDRKVHLVIRGVFTASRCFRRVVWT